MTVAKRQAVSGVAESIMRRVIAGCDARALTAGHARGFASRCGRPIRFAAIGKAAVAMSLGFMDAAAKPKQGGRPWLKQTEGNAVEAGPIVVPEGSLAPDGLGSVLFASHPLPSAASRKAAGRMLRWLAGLGVSSDRFASVVLISGGTSALMCLPAPGLTVRDVACVSRALMRAGATIGELNTVRKHIDLSKGGRLASVANGARLRVMLLSDVIGNDRSVIGSGPFEPDDTTCADALRVLRKRQCLEDCPRVVSALRTDGSMLETPGPGEGVFDRISTSVVADNATAVAMAAEACRRVGVRVVQVRKGVVGEAREVGRDLARRGLRLGPGQAVVFGGETTVTVSGSGRGGRNQEVALGAAVELSSQEAGEGLCVLSMATDGIDGVAPRGAQPVAGAWVTQLTVPGNESGLRAAERALAGNDSFGYFRSIGGSGRGGHLVSGPTATNLNDIAVAFRV